MSHKKSPHTAMLIEQYKRYESWNAGLKKVKMPSPKIIVSGNG